jgi:CubicO group peptidase (beta-lactamase class C family)
MIAYALQTVYIMLMMAYSKESRTPWSVSQEQNGYMGLGSTGPAGWYVIMDERKSPFISNDEQVEALTGQDFESYMQEHILRPVGAKSTTFRPDNHFGDSKWEPLMQEMAEIKPDGTLGKAAPPWHGNPEIALGGIGLYTTPNDYGKLLGALVSGGSPLLRKKSVDELLRPQNISDRAVETLQDFIFGKPYGLDRHIRTTEDKTSPAPLVLQSLAGTVTTEDVKGRRKRGTVNWGGNPNIVWWIDREGGVAAAVFTQLRPNFEMKYTLSLELEDALYKWVDRQGGCKTRPA